MERLNVGDKIWFAKCAWEPVKRVCPTCYGKLEVKLILGNGDAVVLPCDGCSRGYMPPEGVIHEYEYVVEPMLVTVTGMDIDINGDKESIRYRGGGYIYDAKDLFLTEKEAGLAALTKKQKLDNDQKTRAENIKHNVHKKFSWNASYHMREAKRKREDAERHDEKAKLCKERQK